MMSWIFGAVFVYKITTRRGRSNSGRIGTSLLRSALLKVATLDNKQKTNLTSGQVGLTGRCVGQTGSVPGIPDTGICLQDAPIGVRNADFGQP